MINLEKKLNRKDANSFYGGTNHLKIGSEGAFIFQRHRIHQCGLTCVIVVAVVDIFADITDINIFTDFNMKTNRPRIRQVSNPESQNMLQIIFEYENIFNISI